MDGIGNDANVLFLLTTNRPEVLEDAIAYSHENGRAAASNLAANRIVNGLSFGFNLAACKA